MRLFGVKCDRINFADRKVQESRIQWFGIESQRDTYADFVAKMWDLTEPVELEVPLPEIDD